MITHLAIDFKTIPNVTILTKYLSKKHQKPINTIKPKQNKRLKY